MSQLQPESIADQPGAAAGSASAVRQFCPKCGTAWNPLWTECSPCTTDARSPSRPVVGQHVQRGATVVSPLALYFLLLAVSALGILVIRLGHYGDGVVLALECVDAAIVLAWCAVDRKDILPALKIWPRPRWYAIAVGAALVTFMAATLSVKAVQLIIGLPSDAGSDPFLTQPYGWIVAVLSVCLQPAIIEELAFRGVILAGLRRVLENNEAILVSAGLFMILHLTVLSFPHLFLIGVVLGYLRVKTGSLYPGMVMHFTHNLLCLLLEHVSR